MNVLKIFTAGVVASVLFASRVGAEESLPIVEVMAQASSGTFKDIVVGPKVPGVLAALEDRFVKIAKIEFPCMDWVAASAKPRSSAAKLALILSRAKYGAGGSFTIDATLRSSIDSSPLKALEGVTFTLIKPIEIKGEGFSGSEKVTAYLTEKIDDYFSRMGEHLNGAFIRYVPITSVIHVVKQEDVRNARIIVPVNFKKIRLVNDSPILIEIRGEPFCTSQPEDCDVKALSQGREYDSPYEDLLRCRFEKTCCSSLTVEALDKLEVIKGKSVYLAAEHKHCSPFQPDCQKDGIARSMGPEVQKR